MAKTKQTKASKKVQEKVEEVAPVEVAPVEEVPVEETVDVAVEDPFSEISTDFASLVEQLKTVQNTLRDLSSFASKLEKRVAKEGRALAKRANGKKKRRVTNGEPSGFS